MTNTKVSFKHANGQHLQEVMIVIGLIAVVGITALTFFGQTVTNGFSSTSNGMAKPAETTQSSSSLFSNDVVPGSGDTVNLLGGSSINGSNYTSNLSASIETSGANGTSEILLQHLEAKIRQVTTSGDVTAAQANDLQQLANLGHQMAGIEKVLEKTMAENIDNPTALKNKTFTYNNETYTVNELATELQLVEDRFGKQYPISDSTLIGQFLTLQNKITNNLPQNPNNQIIGTLSNQIAAIANITENAANSIIGKQLKSDNFSKTLSELTLEDPSNGALPLPTSITAGSTITNANSAVICKSNGKGNDDGQQCK